MLKLYVRCCSAMLLDLCPKALSPRSTKILSGFWQAIWGSIARIEATFCVKVSGIYSSASCSTVGGSWGQVMLRHVEAICQFCSAMLLVLHPAWQGRQNVAARGWNWGWSTAILWPMLASLPPSWDQLRPSRGPMMMRCGLSSGDRTPASRKTNPNYTPKTLSSTRDRRNSKNHPPKTQPKLSKNTSPKS